MAEVVPTVLAETPDEFAKMLGKLDFADRLHFDVSDGEFAPHRTISLPQVYFPDEVRADLHLMLQRPEDWFETAVSLKPAMIIFHAESDGDLRGLMIETHRFGIKAGLALLPETGVEEAKDLVACAQHVLIFTGHLGYNGGEFDRSQLSKVEQLRELKSGLEISVDGGVHPEIAAEIVAAGVDVLYTGADIGQARHPKRAYRQLVEAAK